jgi:hypothetical protein
VQLDPWYRRAYLAIAHEATVVGWPTAYVEDLTVHDRRQLGELDPRECFAWILRECGTHLIVVDGEPIDRSGNTAHGLIRQCFTPGSWGDKARYYTWDGSTLREVADYEALALWAEKTGCAIERERKRKKAA